jgi:glucose/mannose-6-phosphate isomerase
MRAYAAALPSALLDAYRSGREIALPNGDGVARVFVAGMGASGVAADLVRGVVEAETAVALSVLRGPSLPRSADATSRTIFVSYSGETWETLRAYGAAGRLGCPRVVVTSGGTLAERAEADGVGVVRVPPGLPPRSAVGHLVGGILGLLDPTFPESNESRLTRAAETVGALTNRCLKPKGPAATIAEALGERLPFVYAEASFLALARRWKTQIEENAKRVAAFDEVPEAFHNAIVGWDAITRSEAARYAVVLLEWSDEDPLVRQSFRYLDRLLRAKGVRVVKAPLPYVDRLEAVLCGLAMGDLMSLFLAERRHVDPLPVDAITRLKTALRTGAPGRKGK